MKLVERKKAVVVDAVGADEKLVSNSIQTTDQMLRNCPMPTKEELAKLLAVQGYYLQQIGLDLIADAKNGSPKGKEKKTLVALKALEHSRQALVASVAAIGAVSKVTE